MRIAVTGTTGYLGPTILDYLSTKHDVVVIGREFPEPEGIDAIVNLAAPNHKSDESIKEFESFFLDLYNFVRDTNAPIYNAGSWWELCTGDAQTLKYTKVKQIQSLVLSDCTLTIYSAYADSEREQGRGFIPQLINHVNGGVQLKAASPQPRDWIHALDIAKAFDVALTTNARGRFDVATGVQMSPAALVEFFSGKSLPVYEEFPNVTPPTDMTYLPGWKAEVNVIEYVDLHTK